MREKFNIGFMLSKTADEGENLKVDFNSRINAQDWESVEEEIKRRVAEGYQYWVCDLDALGGLIESATLGTLVSINGIVENHSGQLTFNVSKDSKTLIWIFTITKLDKVLKINQL